MPDPDSSPFDELVGIEWVEFEPERARAQLEVAPHHRQPFGLVLGGVLSTMVESICSQATARAVREAGMLATGQSLDISFLRPLAEGTITVTARARHRGRTTWVWEAEARNESGQLGALARMTIAVRPRPDGAP
jgi:1,4-dihydroxy-2-naphthoyl-CoA hydrolase